MSTDNSRPLNPVGDGRGSKGRFAPGNKAAKGNPHARRTQQIRAALMEAVTPERIKAAAEKLMEQAEAGDRFAFAELLDRTVGRPAATDVLERVEALEHRVREMSDEELMRIIQDGRAEAGEGGAHAGEDA